jgi:hypothetical protein
MNDWPAGWDSASCRGFTLSAVKTAMLAVPLGGESVEVWKLADPPGGN